MKTAPLKSATVDRGGVNAICSRPEVADDIISSRNMKTIDGHGKVDFEVAEL